MRRAFVAGYDDTIDALIPGYRELLTRLVVVVASRTEHIDAICELGSGSGNLTHLLLRQFPGRRMACYDISPHLLRRAKRKTGWAGRRVSYERSDVLHIRSKRDYDAVVSSFFLHELEEDERAEVLEWSFNRLTRHGVFAFVDFVRPAPRRGTSELRAWRNHMKKSGIALADADAEIAAHCIERFSAQSYLRLMRQIGYSDVRCHCTLGFYAVISGKKM